MFETPLSTPRRIIGNLDFEVELARAACPPRGDPRFSLPAEVLEAASAAATLLRAFAADRDVLWTPAVVDPHRMARVPGLPVPLLESGPLEKLPPRAALLAWGETPAVSALRARGVSCPGAETTGPDSPRDSWDPWRIPAPAADAAARVNHRSFCLEVAESLGVALSGAAMLLSVGELEAHLDAGGASASPTGQWVLKAPFSSAARSRLRGGSRKLDAGARRRAERLFDLFGSLLFEPWMNRTADFACAAIAHECRVRPLPPHRNDVDPGGNFRGITIPAAKGDGTALSERETLRLEETVSAVGERILDAGYTGPFTVDCWRYRDREGRIRFHPLGEINARMSFGLVARALVERLTSAGVLPENRAARLRFASRRESTTCEAIVPLVLPSASGRGAVWMETSG